MSASEPLFSILVNNYNYGTFLREAIDSALNQTYPNTEVIVVDDGSTDDSREIITGYEGRIIPVMKENGGQASAFNAGFAASHGEWICLLDSDDTFLPGKVEEVVRLGQENSLVGLIAHNLEYLDINGVPTDFRPPPIVERKLVDDRRRIQYGKPTANLPATSGLCFRRRVLEQILPMPEEIQIAADNFIKTAALLLTPVMQIPDMLGRQRIHDRNFFTTGYQNPSFKAVLYRTRVSAQIIFHLKQGYPSLKRLTWKHYGRQLCELSSLRCDEALILRREIGSQFNVIEFTPRCLFYVAGAFTKAFLRGCLHGRSKP